LKRGIILDENELREVTDYFLSKDRFVFDVESYGEHRGVPHLAPISWISLATYGAGIVIPMGHPNGSKVIGEKEDFAKYKTGAKKGELKKIMVPVYDDPPAQLSTGTVFEILKPLFFSENIRKIGHGSISDFTAVTKYFGRVPLPPYGCTLVKQWLINENLAERELGLKALVKKIYGITYDEEGVGKCVERFPFDIVAYYSYCDSVYDFILDQRLEPQLIEQGLESVYDLEMGVLGALINMKLHGAKMDVPKIHGLEKILKDEVVKTESAVYKAAGKKFNINSNPQKQNMLYGPEGQGLKPWKLTDGGKKKRNLGQQITIKDYSTDDDVLASYPENALAAAMREYSDVNKLLTTYVYGWLGNGIDKQSKLYDNHIHADFLQYGTVTGRFSCRAPNLQNIPRPYTEHGKLLRDIFIPEPGHKLIIADYAQIELVILAHYLGQGKLYEGFLAGIDPHTMTAAMVLDKNPSDVTKVERQDLGKAQPRDAKILTPSGWKTMGEMDIGDSVCVPDGGSARITGVYPQGLRPIYKVTFSDHTSTECDEEHLWQVTTRHSTNKLMTTKEILESGLTYKAPSRGHAYSKYSVKLNEPIKFTANNNLPIDPYLLGLLLGDASFRHPDNVLFASADQFLVDEVSKRIPEGHSLKHKNPKAASTRTIGYDYTIRSGTAGKLPGGAGNMGKLKRNLIELDLFGKNSHNKFIPEQYLLSSVSDRIELLRGLMDTDGHCLKNAGTNEFSTVSHSLAEDVAFLVRSLGGKVTMKKAKTSWTHNGIKKTGTCWRLQIWTPMNPFKLPRKADLHEITKRKVERRTIKSVEFVGYKEAQCIMVDHPDHMYITDDFIPTHNTLGFAVVYGAGLNKVSSMARISVAEAKQVLAKHQRMFPEIHDFKDEVIRTTKSRTPEPYLTTLLGRRRRIRGLYSANEGVRMGAERQAFNSLIQGGAADLIKMSMIRVDAMLPPEVSLIMTVHDELILTSPEDMAQEAAVILKEAMTGSEIQSLVKVPLNVDVHIVDRWSQSK
jgi:DNA polymerase I-like protein with 3'-5' exonuclease and polymerase domains